MEKYFLCLENWTIDSGTYFEKGKKYPGIYNEKGNYARIEGECEMVVNFGKDNLYFDLIK